MTIRVQSRVSKYLRQTGRNELTPAQRRRALKKVKGRAAGRSFVLRNGRPAAGEGAQ